MCVGTVRELKDQDGNVRHRFVLEVVDDTTVLGCFYFSSTSITVINFSSRGNENEGRCGKSLGYFSGVLI